MIDTSIYWTIQSKNHGPPRRSNFVPFYNHKKVKCLADCASDSACASNCTRDQVACSNACPCGADCPNGCDGSCSNPYCQSAVVIHTKAYPVPRTPPVKVDYLGHEYRDFNFEMNDVEVRMSCMTEVGFQNEDMS